MSSLEQWDFVVKSLADADANVKRAIMK